MYPAVDTALSPVYEGGAFWEDPPMMTPALLAALTILPAHAGKCSVTALARIEAATALLAQVPSTPEIDQSSVVERARILLEKVVKEEPRCKDAWVIKSEADGTVLTLTPVSRDANLEAAVTEATERVVALEGASPPNPEHLEALRFFLHDLESIAPEDTRIKSLASRAAKLGGVQ